MTTANSLPGSSVPTTKSTTGTNTEREELPKIQLQRFEKDTRKRRNPTSRTSKTSASKQAQPTSSLPPLPPETPIVSFIPVQPPPEPIKVLPLTLFDLNGSSEYYEHMLPFLDTNALHLICIHTADFHQTTPKTIQEIFNGTYDLSSSDTIRQLFQILQLLCDKATKTRTILIVPIATCIDQYDKRPSEEK